MIENEKQNPEIPAVKILDASTAIASFAKSVTDSTIDEMRSRYLPLKIKSMDDIENYKEVKEARLIVRRKRIDIENVRKDLTEESVKYQKAVNGEAKRITGRLEEIEVYLSDQEFEFERFQQKEKERKDRQKQELIQARINGLFQLGAAFNGTNYTLGKLAINSFGIEKMDDQQWAEFIEMCNNEKARIDHERYMIEEQEAKAKENKDEEIAKLKKMLQEKEDQLKKKEIDSKEIDLVLEQHQSADTSPTKKSENIIDEIADIAIDQYKETMEKLDNVPQQPVLDIDLDLPDVIPPPKDLPNPDEITSKDILNDLELFDDLESLEQSSEDQLKEHTEMDLPNKEGEDIPTQESINSQAEIKSILAYIHQTNGLWCIDKDPKTVTLKWIRENSFQIFYKP